jgi:hypothetical protein
MDGWMDGTESYVLLVFRHLFFFFFWTPGMNLGKEWRGGQGREGRERRGRKKIFFKSGDDLFIK